MVKGYQFKCDYGDGCGMKEHKSHEHLGADYVLATDYAALEAERDEWKRRCGNMVEMLDPGSGQFGRVEDNKTLSLTVDEWNLLVGAHDRALAIAEGRDNG